MSERELDQELGNNWKTEVWEGRKVRDYDRERRCSQPVGIVEKELVKRDYRMVLEAWWTRCAGVLQTRRCFGSKHLRF